MGEHQQPRMRVSDFDRDAVITILQDAHASGRLDLDEFEERQDAALAARYFHEVTALVADLPEGRHLIGLGGPVNSPMPSAGAGRVVPTRNEQPGFKVVFMTGRAMRLEPGSPGRRDLAVWGGHDIYVADAMGRGNVVVMHCSALMGGHNIYVPAGVRVVDETTAVMGGCDVEPTAMGDGSNGTLVLRGFVMWGGHDVKLDPATIQGPPPRY